MTCDLDARAHLCQDITAQLHLQFTYMHKHAEPCLNEIAKLWYIGESKALCLHMVQQYIKCILDMGNTKNLSLDKGQYTMRHPALMASLPQTAQVSRTADS